MLSVVVVARSRGYYNFFRQAIVVITA